MELFAALSHPLRQKILKVLDTQRQLTYKQLMEKLNVSETGLLNYHLKKLGALVEKENSRYRLTTEGQTAIQLLNAKEQLMAGEPIEVQTTSRHAPIHRIGVIVCSCDVDISQTINIPLLAERVSDLPHVVSTQVFQFLCIIENVEQIKEWCEAHFINGLVIAACSPRLHHEMFKTISDQLGIPVEFSNIREQCAWVHRQELERATEKALLLISASVEMLRHRVTVPKRTLPIRKAIGIVGAGLAGLTAAGVLAKSGYKTVLLERDYCLGGTARRWARIYESIDCSPCMITEQVASLVMAGNIEIHTSSEVTAISGAPGSYEITTLQYPRYVDTTRCTTCGICVEVCPQQRPNEFELGLGQHPWIHLPCPFVHPNKPVLSPDDIEICRRCRKCAEACPANAIDLAQEPAKLRYAVGTVILATGAALTTPELVDPELPIRYDPRDDVISSYEFERMLAADGPTGGQVLRVSNGKPAKSVVILQCINSTSSCSQYCCNVAKKYLESIRGTLHNDQVYIIFERSRIPTDRSILLPDDDNIRFCETLSIEQEGRLRRVVTDVGDFPADLIVLNMGMTPGEALSAYRSVVTYSLDNRGYLEPGSLPSGIWACGSMTGPKAYQSLIMEARNAALEALLYVGKDSLEEGDVTVRIDNMKCGLCGLCVEACPSNAITRVVDTFKVDSFKCSGCAACVVACPTGAITAGGLQDEIHAAIIALAQGKKKPRVLVMCCESCGYPAIDNAGVRGLQYDPGIVVLGVPCAGSVDAEYVLSALRSGFDGVVIVGCHEDSCRYFNGIRAASLRIETLSEIYQEEMKGRVRLLNVSAVEGHTFSSWMEHFTEELRESVDS